MTKKKKQNFKKKAPPSSYLIKMRALKTTKKNIFTLFYASQRDERQTMEKKKHETNLLIRSDVKKNIA